MVKEHFEVHGCRNGEVKERLYSGDKIELGDAVSEEIRTDLRFDTFLATTYRNHYGALHISQEHYQLKGDEDQPFVSIGTSNTVSLKLDEAVRKYWADLTK